MKITMPNMFVGILRMSMENFSIITIGIISLTFLLLKETHNLRKGHMIMSTLLVLMTENTKNVVVTMFSLTVL